MVLFQAPFSFASSGFMAMFGNGMCYKLWIAPVAIFKAIHGDQVHQELHHGNGSKPQW